MNKLFLSATLCFLLAAPAFAAKGPLIDLVDNKLSIDADTIPLARLLRLLDTATGMKSKVPPELANRNISVKFSGLSVEDGVRKIFEGQPVDYVVIEGRGVMVTAASQNITGTETVPAYAASPEQPFQDFQQQFQPNFPGQPGLPGQNVIPGQQPTIQQTPFGPQQIQRPQPNAPLAAPGQNNSIFPSSLSFSNPTQQGVPGNTNVQPGGTAPFGTPSSFGTPPQNNPTNNNVFGGANLFPGNQQPH